MQINGFQKLTLLDYPGKVACTLFTAGCNFRCPFCHNASLVLSPDMSNGIPVEEILAYLSKRTGILEGVCITGGEPLLQRDLPELLQRIKALGYAIKLDTNGFFPDKLKELVQKELVDYVAIDIKNAKDKYAQTVGLSNFDVSKIEESVAFLLSNQVDYEFRTTIVKELHDVVDIQHIGELIKGAPRYYLQNFVDSGELIPEGLNPVEMAVLKEMQKAAQMNIPNTMLRGV